MGTSDVLSQLPTLSVSGAVFDGSAYSLCTANTNGLTCVLPQTVSLASNGSLRLGNVYAVESISLNADGTLLSQAGTSVATTSSTATITVSAVNIGDIANDNLATMPTQARLLVNNSGGLVINRYTGSAPVSRTIRYSIALGGDIDLGKLSLNVLSDAMSDQLPYHFSVYRASGSLAVPAAGIRLNQIGTSSVPAGANYSIISLVADSGDVVCAIGVTSCGQLVADKINLHSPSGTIGTALLPVRVQTANIAAVAASLTVESLGSMYLEGIGTTDLITALNLTSGSTSSLTLNGTGIRVIQLSNNLTPDTAWRQWTYLAR